MEIQLKSKDSNPTGVAIGIIITGLKEGEKLHEELTFNENPINSTKNPQAF